MARSVLWATLFLLFTTPSAMAMDLFDGCYDNNERRIDVKDDYAELGQGIVKGKANLGVILVNRKSPYLYLSDQTLRWLFFRQCYFVRQNIDEGGRDVATNEKADCWAIQHLSDKENFSRKDVLTIERDLETLAKEDANWTAVAGPWRSPRLTNCP